jgi:hypothetical protein
MERPTKEELEEVRTGVAECCDIRWKTAGNLLAEIDALRHDLALSQARERDAVRRGFDAGQALDEYGNTKFPFWEDYAHHLAELEEHAAREIRNAEAEESEKWPEDG